MDNEIGSLLTSWQRSLRARNLAPKTIKTYLEAAGQLVDHVTAVGVQHVAEIERHHIEEFIAEQVETRSAATASVRFRALQQFFAWCGDEEELDVNPMAKMRPPVVPERPVPVLAEDKARALLKACAGSGFVPRRDTAIVRLFLDTGMRLSELAKLRLDEVDLDDDVATPPEIEGVEIRPLAAGQERIAYNVHQETFEDSWDHVREPYDEWRHYLVDIDSYDPSLWLVAWDGDEPAGISLGRIRGDVGWIGILGVRRAWRRRGVGRALLLHSFREFRDRELTRAGLGVDAESLTGAHKLYAAAGMRVVRELGHYEKPVPA